MKVSVFNRVLSLSLYCITTLWEVSISPMFPFLFYLRECLCWVRKTLEGGYCYAPSFFSYFLYDYKSRVKRACDLRVDQSTRCTIYSYEYATTVSLHCFPCLGDRLCLAMPV